MIDLKKRIFITWATWFVGANVLHWLLSLWASDIHILIRADSDLSRIYSIMNQVKVHTFSLGDREETLKNIWEIKPQIIFHIAAAGTAVWRAQLNIDDLIYFNSLGSIHLIDASIAVGTCEVFVNTGSSSEYGQKEEAMSESDMIEPNNLYGISKAVATHYATYVGKQKLLPIVTYRIFAAYWPYEDTKRLIPTLVRSCIDGISPALSSPYSVRDFIYVWDIVLAFLESDMAMKHGWDIINLGTGSQTSVGEIVDILKSITGKSLNPTYWSKQIYQLEPQIWLADNTKMKKILWVSPIPLEDGLEKLLQYIKNNH